TIDGVKLIIAMTDRKIVAVAEADGKQVWETPFVGQGMGGYNAATPVIDGQTIIFSGGGRGTKAVKLEKQGEGFVGKELWSNPETSVLFNSPVVKDGFIYGLSGANQ